MKTPFELMEMWFAIKQRQSEVANNDLTSSATADEIKRIQIEDFNKAFEEYQVSLINKVAQEL